MKSDAFPDDLPGSDTTHRNHHGDRLKFVAVVHIRASVIEMHALQKRYSWNLGLLATDARSP